MKKYFILVLLLIFSFSYSAEIYVNAKLGNNITGDGSEGNPYATITKALVDASDGIYDTIYFVFSDTTLAEEITLNKQRVAIVGIGNSKPRISGLGVASTNRIIQDNNIDHSCDSFYISNIEFDSPYYFGILFDGVSAENIKINNNYFNNSYIQINLYSDPGKIINNYEIKNNTFINASDRGIYLVAEGVNENGIIKNNYIANHNSYGIRIRFSNFSNIKIYNNIFENLPIGIENSAGAENVVKYLEYNNFYNCTTDIVDNNPPTIKYNLNPYLLTSDTLGVDTFYIGYFSDLTPDTLITGGTGTYKQVGLDWEGQANNIIYEKYFEPDTYIIVIANDFFSYDTQALILLSDNFSGETCNLIVYNNNYTNSEYIIARLIPNDTLTLIPLSGQQFFNGDTVIFQWDIPKGANTIFLQTAKDSNYTIDTTQDTITGINEASFEKSFSDIATYYWRGQAKYVP